MQSLEEKIRELAYEKWEQAGRPCGDGRDFWEQAEYELSKSSRSKATSETLKTAAKKSTGAK